MKRILTILCVAGALFCTHSLVAQDGGKKDKKKKKDKKEAVVDTVAQPAEITIDEPGTGKNHTHNQSNKTSDTTANKPGGSPVNGLERPEEPKEEAKEAPEPKKEEAKEAEAGSGTASEAKEAEKTEDMGQGDDAPAGAGSLDAGGSGQITIDEAGTQKVKKPSEAVNDAINGGASPENLTIDEAGTQKKKSTSTAQNATDTTGNATTTVQEQAKEEVKQEVKEEVKKEAGKKALELIRPK